MADPPGTISTIDRPGAPRGFSGVWARRAAVGVLWAFVLAGLAGAFGQGAETGTATGPGVRLTVDGPERLRTGDIGQMRIVVATGSRLVAPRLVLGEAFLDRFTVNTTTPQPDAEEVAGNRWVLAYGPVPAGGELVVRIQFQVNPGGAGIRDRDVAIRDGGRVLASLNRRLVVFP